MKHFPDDHVVKVRIKTTNPKYAMPLVITHFQIQPISPRTEESVETPHSPQGDYIPKR